MTVTLTLDLPAETSARLAAASAERIARINRFAAAMLPELLADEPDADAEPLDLDLIAELRAGDDEAARVGTTPFEEVVARMEADDGPGMVELARARIAAYKASPEHTLFEADKARHKAALEAEYSNRKATA